uniref:TRIO and F-actin binding protein n=1 Tax=Lynx canadensis TaxID=61383 RepID=A0A667G725_LYNCA
MEGGAGTVPCEHFEANVLAQGCCQNCFHPEEAHRARSQEPGSPPGAEVPYCDLPRRLPVSEGPLGSSTSGCQSVVGLGLGPGPERWVEPQAWGGAPEGRMPSPAPTLHPFTMAGSVCWLPVWVIWSGHTAWA